ncbi:dolichyl-phosphate-mannose--protein mannosyltransferase [Leptospira sp. WS39.C2]
MYRLDRQSLWTDELYSVYASSLKNWNVFWDYLASDPHPPLFQVLLAFWMNINPNPTEFYIKLFPIFISILNLIVLFFLTKSWENSKRFIFLFLFSFSPGAIYYAQEVRSYSLLLCLSSVILVIFDGFLGQSRDKKRLTLILVLSVLISYVHLFGFIFVGSLYFIFWIKFLIEKDNKSKDLIIIGILTFIFFIPFIYQLLNGSKIATAGWIDPPGFVLYLSYYSLFFYTSKKFLFLTVLVPIGFFFFYLYTLIKRKTKQNEFRFSNSEIYLLVAIFLILITSIFSFFKPIVTNRNWIVTLPLVYLFVSDKVSTYRYRKYFLVGLLLLTLFSMIDFKKNFYIIFKEDWRGATNYIAKECNHPIVLSNATPEYIDLYLNWFNVKNFDSLLVNKNISINQDRICELNRLLGGNGESIQNRKGWKMEKEEVFYGIVVREYLKND